MKHWQGYLFALGAVSIWSGFILVSRFGGMSQLQPWDMMAIRYGTCSLILLPVWLIWWRFPVWQPRFLISASLGGLAYALCVEAGKPINDAKGEVTRLIDTFKIAAEETPRLYGESGSSDPPAASPAPCATGGEGAREGLRAGMRGRTAHRAVVSK